MARKKKNAGSVPLTSPQTREEHYLASIAGLVGTKPEYPFTRTERYLDAISGSTSGLSDRVTTLETGKVNNLGKGYNLLINAHFYRPVNQRAIPMDTWISATDPETYNFIDRWKLTSGRAKLTVSGVVLEGTMIQTLEFSLHGDVAASVLTTDGYVTPEYSNETKTFTITATGETLVAAKLELGTTQTLYSGTVLLDAAPNYQQELAKCQRYLTIYRGRAYIGYGYVDNNNAVVTVTTPVPMERIINVASSGIYAYVFGTGWIASTSTPFISDRSANLVTYSVPLVSTPPAGSPVFLKFDDLSIDSNYLVFSAE